jgi:hypothetical protein
MDSLDRAGWTAQRALKRNLDIDGPSFLFCCEEHLKFFDFYHSILHRLFFLARVVPAISKRYFTCIRVVISCSIFLIFG